VERPASRANGQCRLSERLRARFDLHCRAANRPSQTFNAPFDDREERLRDGSTRSRRVAPLPAPNLGADPASPGRSFRQEIPGDNAAHEDGDEGDKDDGEDAFARFVLRHNAELTTTHQRSQECVTPATAEIGPWAATTTTPPRAGLTAANQENVCERGAGLIGAPTSVGRASIGMDMSTGSRQYRSRVRPNARSQRRRGHPRKRSVPGGQTRGFAVRRVAKLHVCGSIRHAYRAAARRPSWGMWSRTLLDCRPRDGSHSFQPISVR